MAAANACCVRVGTACKKILAPAPELNTRQSATFRARVQACGSSVGGGHAQSAGSATGSRVDIIFIYIESTLKGPRDRSGQTTFTRILGLEGPLSHTAKQRGAALIGGAWVHEGEVLQAMITVYHSPKQGDAKVSKEEAEADGHAFFLREDDPNFQPGKQLYWFSSLPGVARSHADYWTDASGLKWRLTLRCQIPANSQVVDVHNYHGVRCEDIVILEKIWWR